MPCERARPRHRLTLLPHKHRLDHGTAFQLISGVSQGSSGRLWLCNKQVILLYTASYKLILLSVCRDNVWEGEFKRWGILGGTKFLWLLKLRSQIKKGKATQSSRRWASALGNICMGEQEGAWTGLRSFIFFSLLFEERKMVLSYTMPSIHLTWDFSMSVHFRTGMLKTWRAPFSLAAVVWEVVCSFTKRYYSRSRKARRLMTYPFKLMY